MSKILASSARSTKAFSLLELLVVVAVIAVLALLTIPLIGFIRERARWTVTTVRMQDILTSAAALDKPVLSLQRQAYLGGVTLFVRKNQAQIDLINAKPSFNNPFLDTPMAAKPSEWLTQAEYDQPWFFGFPWNESDRIQARPSANLPAGTVFETQAVDSGGFQTTSISDLSPQRSFELMSALGYFTDVADGPVSYRTDRGSDRRWNDAWGRPLIVAYGFFQPPPRTAVLFNGNAQASSTIAQDGWRISESFKIYGYDRAVYLAIGATGRGLPPGLDPAVLVDPSATLWASTVLPALWGRVTTVCGGASWSGASFAAPPWNSVTMGKDASGSCVLSAPTLLH